MVTVIVCVRVGMTVAVIMIVRVGMAVAVIVTVVMIMVVVARIQDVLVFVAVYRREARRVSVLVVMIMVVFVAMIMHAELGGVDAVLENFFCGDGVAFDAEGLQAFFDGVEVGARVDKGTHGHVAADTAEAVEVTGFHGVLPRGWASWVIGKLLTRESRRSHWVIVYSAR
jgi:hypothetical protein